MYKVKFFHVCLLVGAAIFSSQAVSQHRSTLRTDLSINYESLFEGCGKSDFRNLMYVKFAKGYWPIPNSLSLIGNQDGMLEFTDHAYPFVRIVKGSTLFIGSGKKILPIWESAKENRPPLKSYSQCGISIDTYSRIENVAQEASIVTDGSTYILLVGPIVSSTKKLLQCYVQTVQAYARKCD
jgi:hypothetical protein